MRDADFYDHNNDFPMLKKDQKKISHHDIQTKKLFWLMFEGGLYLSFLIFFLTISNAWAVEKNHLNSTLRFLALADIHFDPFISCNKLQHGPCPLIQKLEKASAQEWATILEKNAKERPQYRQDTNYVLLKSGLAAAKEAAESQQVQFVIVLGDFLGHEYKTLYRKYSNNKSAIAYRAFVKKTFAFLTAQFIQTFPKINVYPLLGNNDSYQEDYVTDLNGNFFKDIAHIWLPLIHEKDDRLIMQREFATAGYYALDIQAAPELRLIALNTALFSYKASGKNIDQAANKQLAWLQTELQSTEAKEQQTFIVMHIPEGIDLYTKFQYHFFRLMELWKTSYTKMFNKELEEFSASIDGIFFGHLHYGSFQMLALADGAKIPVTGVPSISPIFGNNPGFKIYTYALDSRDLKESATYYYMIDKNSWYVEYQE